MKTVQKKGRTLTRNWAAYLVKETGPGFVCISFKVFEGETPARHLLFGGIVGVLF